MWTDSQRSRCCGTTWLHPGFTQMIDRGVRAGLAAGLEKLCSRSRVDTTERPKCGWVWVPRISVSDWWEAQPSDTRIVTIPQFMTIGKVGENTNCVILTTGSIYFMILRLLEAALHGG